MGVSNNKPDYGSWIPERLLVLLGACCVVSTVLLGMSISQSWSWIWIIISLIISLILWVVFIYLFAFHRELDKGLMSRIHDYVKAHLSWDGKGKLLDVGCGAGALTIRCAKGWNEGDFTGIDYYGVNWDYSLKMCQHNATVEGVADRCHFQKGDASHLDFPDETFDAVVSNFVYHEVRNNPDKEALIKETLRVLKKGGCFALQDIFGQKMIYGDFDATVERLKAEVTELHYIRNPNNEMNLPRWMILPYIFADVGLLYGIK